jgi:dTDP-glucose 4,6-dehydratase
VTRTVLVTGVGGFVGSHVVETILARTTWHVVGVESFRHNGEFTRLLDALDGDTSRVTTITHDLNVPLPRRQLDRLIGVDYVVNVASRSHVDESVAEPAEFVTNNVQLMLTVLEMCRHVQPHQLLHVSTDEVHGPDAHESPVAHRPSSPYAASKAAQADLVWAYAQTYGIPSTVVASANMFGERQGDTAFIPLIVRALVTQATLGIHYHDGRPGERSYTYVRNVAERIVDELTVTRDYEAPRSRSDVTVNYVRLPGQCRIDNERLARRVAELTGRPIRLQRVAAQSVRPGYDPTYADLGEPWTPSINFDDGLERTVRWALNHYAEDGYREL